jgi:hypothetical protein
MGRTVACGLRPRGRRHATGMQQASGSGADARRAAAAGRIATKGPWPAKKAGEYGLLHPVYSEVVAGSCRGVMSRGR